jgi:predicted MFS family arabinose efflux permease
LVFVFHQLGGANAAVAGGWARVQFGAYQYVFLTGGCLGLFAACLAVTVRRTERGTPVMDAATDLTGA